MRCIRLLHDWEIGDKKLVVKVDAKTKQLLDNYKVFVEWHNPKSVFSASSSIIAGVLKCGFCPELIQKIIRTPRKYCNQSEFLYLETMFVTSRFIGSWYREITLFDYRKWIRIC